jgi:hypothetical protein
LFPQVPQCRPEEEDETQFLALRFMPSEPLPSEAATRQREVDDAVRKLTHPVERPSPFQRFLDDHLRWGQVAGRFAPVPEQCTARFKPSTALLRASRPPPPAPRLDPLANRPAGEVRAHSSSVRELTPLRRGLGYLWMALVIASLTAALLSPISSRRRSASKAHPVSAQTH